MTEPGTASRTEQAVEPIVLRLSLIAAASVMLSVQLHEYAHGLTALVETGGMIVRSGSAGSITPGSDLEMGIEALAGPLFSLISGGAVYFATRRLDEGFWRWVATWFGLASMMNFFGYLMTSIAGGPGDIAGAIRYFGAPGWLSIPLFFVGTAGMFWLAWLFCHDVRRVADHITLMRRVGIWPWLFGTLIVVVVRTVLDLATPAATGLTGAERLLIAIASFASLVFAPMFTFFVKVLPYRGGRPDPGPQRSVVVYFVVALLIWTIHSIWAVTIGS